MGRRIDGVWMLAFAVVMATLCPLSSGRLTLQQPQRRLDPVFDRLPNTKPGTLLSIEEAPDSKNETLDRGCLRGCLCRWDGLSLVTLSCLSNDLDDNGECNKEEARSMPASFWKALESIELEGRQNYDCLAPVAFAYAYNSLRNLVLRSVNASTNILKDISHLENLRDLTLVDVGLKDDSDFSSINGLVNLESLNLSDNDFQYLDVDFIFQWSTSLKALNISDCSHLKAVKMSYDAFTFDGRVLSRLEKLTLSNHPKIDFLCKWFLLSSPSVKTVDLSENPELKVHLSSLLPRNVSTVSLNGTSFLCDCYISRFSRIAIGGISLKWPCFKVKNGSLERIESFEKYMEDPGNCDDLPVDHPIMRHNVTVAYPNGPVILNCGNVTHMDFVSWITPVNEIRIDSRDPISAINSSRPSGCLARHDLFESACVPKEEYLVLSRIVYTSGGSQHAQILSNGSLLISYFGWRDRGRYQCFAWTRKGDRGSITNTTVDVGLRFEYRKTLYNVSLIYGLSTAGGFLLITLLAKLIYFVLHNYGCCLFCCCCKDQLPPKARRLKNALDSIEAYRTQQQEKLRENYHLQVC